MARDPNAEAQQPGADKATRLAAQLRANLRRRKAQTSARRDASAEPGITNRPAAAPADKGKT